MRLNDLLKKVLAGDLVRPGLNYVLVAHDSNCPTLARQGGQCTCEPDVHLTEEQAFTRVVKQNRAARREAQRTSRRAAAKRGGAK